MNEVSPPKPSSGPNLFDLLSSKGWVGKIDWALFSLALFWPVISRLWLGWAFTPIILVSILIFLVWLVVLAYRIAYFVIIVQVALDSMPATSARLAVKFLKTTPMNMPGGA